MLALILAMLFCVAVGAGVVGYVLVEARREGRGGFWTAEGEELIAGARRTGEKVRTRGGQLGRTAAERTGLSAPSGLPADDRAARTPVRPDERTADGYAAHERAADGYAADGRAADEHARVRQDDGVGGQADDARPGRTDGYRAAS